MYKLIKNSKIRFNMLTVLSICICISYCNSIPILNILFSDECIDNNYKYTTGLIVKHHINDYLNNTKYVYSDSDIISSNKYTK